MAQVVEHLLNKHEAPSSNTSTAQKKFFFFDQENPLPGIFPLEIMEHTSKDCVFKNVCQIVVL
jgi:hypothetical protein